MEKTANDNTTRYIYDDYARVVLETDARGVTLARNLYGINLIARTADSQTAYYFYNGHADVTYLFSAADAALATYYYDAFGNIIEETGTFDNPFRYAGYQYDAETKLYYLQSRMYDPETARFLQEDSFRGRINDPLSLNLYTYCHNEPIMYWDPFGDEDVLVNVKDDKVILGSNDSGTTTVGLRDLVNALGGTIEWDSKTNAVKVNVNGKEMVYIANSSRLTVPLRAFMSVMEPDTSVIYQSDGDGATTVDIGSNGSNKTRRRSDDMKEKGTGESAKTPISETPNIQIGHIGVVYFDQDDPEWGSNSYTSAGDSSQTISSSGCGPTSMAMVISSLTGSVITPDVLANYSVAQGFRTKNNGTSHAFFASAAKEYGIEVETTGEWGKASKALEEGDIIIASMTKGHLTAGGHYVVLTGIDSKRKVVYVNDPNGNARYENYATVGLVSKTGNTVSVNKADTVFNKEVKTFWIFRKKKSA